MAPDLYERFRIAYPHYDKPRSIFFRTVRLFHLFLQDMPGRVPEDEYDRCILRYTDTYLPAFEAAIRDPQQYPLPLPPFACYASLSPESR